ncbi:hypothetical protein Tco_0431517 [Tanacetum coccineum]
MGELEQFTQLKKEGFGGFQSLCANRANVQMEVKKLQNQGVNIFDYIRIKIGNGDNTSFWKDKWHNEGVLKDVFPQVVWKNFNSTTLQVVSRLPSSSAVERDGLNLCHLSVNIIAWKMKNDGLAH